MNDQENRDRIDPDQYNSQYNDQIQDDEDFRPPVDVTPPDHYYPNISTSGEPDLLPDPEQPVEKKGLFGKKGKKEKKEKAPKQKKEKVGGNSGDEGTSNKLKGLFRKNKKEATAIQIIDSNDGDLGTRQTSLAGTPTQPSAYSGYPVFQGNQVPTYPSGTPSHTGPKSAASYLRRPPPNYQKEGCAEVNTPPKKSIFRCSNFIVVLLILGCIAGIVMTAAAGDITALTVIGPFFIGVSLFALVGKIFFTLFWTKEAHPMLKPASKAINKQMKTGPNYQEQQYAMNTYNYPRSSAYNRAYDTSPVEPPPLSLTAPAEYMSEDDFTPYDPTSNYHEEPVHEDYGYEADGQYNIDMKENGLKKNSAEDFHKLYDEVDMKKDNGVGEGPPRFV